MDRRPLPRADTTTEVLLLALCERLDEVIDLLTQGRPEPARKRAPGTGGSRGASATPDAHSRLPPATPAAKRPVLK